MLRQALLTVSLLIASSAYAGGNWMVTDEGCSVWNPAPESGETASWDGECANGVAQGHGTVKWFKDGIAGNEVEGDYADGSHKGKVIVRYPSGDIYDGFLSEETGNRNGHGVLTKADGSIKSGIWVNGRLSSVGQPQAQPSGPSALERFGNWGKAYQDYEKQNRGTNCTSTMQNGTVFTHCN